MLISCTFSIVGLHLILLAHIAHSFILLTANVDDVKKIARKFVSDSLAEKIADFIARATETMAKNMKISEENDNNADALESSQVSAENRQYSVERHASDSLTVEVISNEEIVLGKVPVKVPKKTFVEKKRHEFKNAVTTQKPRQEPKPLHGRSRYIIRTDNKASLATKKALSKISEEENYSKMKESFQLIEDKFFRSTGGKIKNKTQKKIRPYKLPFGFASVENEAAKSGNKETKDDERFSNVRAMDDKEVLSLPTVGAATGIEQNVTENEIQTVKAVTVVAQHYDETRNDKNTEIVATNESMPTTERDEFDHDEHKIIESTEKVTSGSRYLVAETGNKKENWWEKELPANNHEVNSKGKSWF